MQGILGRQIEAERQALERDAMNLRGGVLRQEPSMLQTIGSQAKRLFFGDKNMYGNDPLQPSVMDSQYVRPEMAEGAVLDVVGGPLTFAGIGAKTANKLALKKAQEMAGKGVNRDKIWKDTGWFKDVDGKWKFEIDDSGALLDKSAFEKGNYSTNPNYSFSYEGDLSGALKHPNLYKAYPDSRKINARIGFDEGPSTRFHTLPDGTLPHSAGGSFSPMFNRIETKAGYTEPSSRSTTLHELQHAIQGREGFARGGDPTDVGLQQSYWDKYARDYRVGGGPELLDKSDQLSRVMRDLRYVDHINDLRNITQPRQLFNSMQFYEHSRTLRNALGPTPKRGPKYKKWAQDAGKMLADILVGKRQNSNIDKLMTQDRATIKKMLRNAEAREVRLNKKGAMEMRRVRKKMDETDPYNYPWDLERLYEGYRNLAGEAEARNVQTRMGLTPKQRQTQPPWETLDVPEDELLVRGILSGQ